MKSLIGHLRTSPLALKFALTILPGVTWITRGRFGTGNLAYRIYSVTPLSLSLLAARSSRRVAGAVKEPVIHALLRMTSNRFAFDAGKQLDEWRQLTEEALTLCDESLARNAPVAQTADLIFAALLLLFHPSVHQGTRPSPFVESSEVTRSLMGHECMKALQSAHFDPSISRSAPSQNMLSPGQPINLLVLTDTNFNFMGSILEHWENNSQVNLRVRDLSAESTNSGWWHLRNTIVDRLSGRPPAIPNFLEDDLLWADVVFVEWSQALAARLSGIDFSAKLFVRLHRYEAFIATPSLTNWGNVDSLITITPYMSTLLERTVPDIQSRTKISLIPNVTELASFALPKHNHASRTIGLIQYASLVKDPMWALDVLDLLRQQDQSWKLLIVGAPPPETGMSDESAAYFASFDQRAAVFGDAVQFLGYRTDLANVFREVGVVLSSSRVEGAPVSIQEGLASGAFPVIRNWPIIKAIGAAESLYPSDWIVDTPEEAAARILAWAGYPNTPIDESESRTWVIRNFDARLTQAKLNNTVLQFESSASDSIHSTAR